MTHRLTAREKFPRGAKVRLSAKGEVTFPNRRTSTGRVVGFGRQDHLVLIQPNGGKAYSSYHMDFWDVASKPAITARDFAPRPPRAATTNLRGRIVVFMQRGRERHGVIVTRTRGTRWLVEGSSGERLVLDESEFTIGPSISLDADAQHSPTAR